MALQANMLSIIKVFDQYAGKDGDNKYLSQDELVELAIKEFPALCAHEKKDEILKGVFGKLDMDGDKKVSFEEFITFFATLSIILKQHICP